MDFIDILLGITGNPVLYSLLFLVYVILAVIILPIPVEIGLFNPLVNPLLLIMILAIGKGVGSLIVFEIGLKVRQIFEKWTSGTPLTKKILLYCERFVKKYGYVGLFIIMSTPLMIDSLSLYLFSLLNSTKDGGDRALTRGYFVLINVIAGAVRGSIILLVAYGLGYRLV
jgi:membrane protein YqaA with SNARE-associated domain